MSFGHISSFQSKSTVNVLKIQIIPYFFGLNFAFYAVLFFLKYLVEWQTV